MAISERLQIAKHHIAFARTYTMTLLEGLEDDQWYWTPNPSVSHIAWQAGHIAMAQYGLTLFRQRGRQFADSKLMSGKFRKRFMKGTTPESERAVYPEPSEILDVLDRVNAQMLAEIDGYDGQALDEPLEMPFTHYPTRYGSLLFAGDHEMLHSGQIGMLRRLMGLEPIR